MLQELKNTTTTPKTNTTNPLAGLTLDEDLQPYAEEINELNAHTQRLIKLGVGYRKWVSKNDGSNMVSITLKEVKIDKVGDAYDYAELILKRASSLKDTIGRAVFPKVTLRGANGNPIEVRLIKVTNNPRTVIGATEELFTFNAINSNNNLAILNPKGEPVSPAGLESIGI